MCRSIRNGIVEDILAQQLVPGDLILIANGDRVPADVRLLEVSDIGNHVFNNQPSPRTKIAAFLNFVLP